MNSQKKVPETKRYPRAREGVESAGSTREELPAEQRLTLLFVSASMSHPLGMLQARILEWVAMPSSRGSSQPRDPPAVICTEGGFFTS